ncbi:hypothetical protein QEN19_001109 [Hanseniaspora menglaensis]
MAQVFIFTRILLFTLSVVSAFNLTLSVPADGLIPLWIALNATHTPDYDIINFIRCVEFNYNRAKHTNFSLSAYEQSRMLMLSFPDPAYHADEAGLVIRKCSAHHYANHTIGFFGIPGKYDTGKKYVGNLNDGFDFRSIQATGSDAVTTARY